ncbi:MAG: OmpA family protein [Desulfobacterales bacterium]|jgi:chemotaxis protein MotB
MGKRKKSNGDVESGTDIGIVMTVSLFLILLTFFILLNSIAVIDEHRSRVAIGSLIGAFGGLPGGLSPMDSGKSVLPPSAPMIDEDLTIEQLMSYVQRDVHGIPGEIKIVADGDEKKIIINESALYNEKEHKLKPSIRAFLYKVSRIIRQGDFPVEIAGFTDNVEDVRNGYRSNWELSTIMALKVLKYFVSDCGVLPGRLTAYGNGSNHPIVSNDTRKSRARNKRVEICLKYNPPAYIKRIFEKKPHGFFTYKKFDFKIF